MKIQAGIIILSALLVMSCTQTGTMGDGSATEGYREVQDLYVVDCLLPGQVRRLGTTTYMSDRRPIRTTAGDCRIRGGEYIEYDRADYRSALRVWLPQAELGDAEAQNYVGEIFEKGLGQEADYVSARQWYEKAAAQGYTRAQINLGYLYEKGLGVPSDVTVALNWYRQASGLADDELVLGSEARQAIEDARAELDTRLANSRVQTEYLQQQISALKQEAEQSARRQETAAPDSAAEVAAAQQKIAALSALYEQAESERRQLSAQIDSMSVAWRKHNEQSFLSPQTLEKGTSTVVRDINFGRYFALIIGNQDYLFMDSLRSPLLDAEKLKSILETKYGFSVLMIPNGNEKGILNTINDFYGQIGENDNLLIYYAGHGNISRSDQSRTERGYWLPVDANKDNISNWINNAVISDHLDRMKARSILVISDSCFAGQLGSDKSPFLFGISGDQESESAIRTGIKRRSRVVISSGGLKPVMDGSSGRHSVFASALLDALENNTEALRDSRLFAQLSVNVRKRSEQTEEVQIPEMKPVREAGHEGGAFYFVPVDARS